MSARHEGKRGGSGLHEGKPMHTTRHQCHSKMRSHAPSKPCLIATFLLRFPLAPFRPAFRKGQGAGAKGTTLALTRPRLATRLSAVDRQPRPKGWHEKGAHAVASLRRVMGLGMHQQGLADVIPSEREVIRASLEVFGPGVARVAA